MDDRDGVCWLHRRAGLGLHPTELEAAVARGPQTELDRLLAPDAAGVATDPDPWDDARLGPVRKPTREQRLYAIGAWLAHMTAAGRPFEARLTWILHGWLVSSMNKVNSPRLLAQQIRLYQRSGAGSFPDLLAAVTVDPAMLDYLDGRTSTGTAPNENYGRELMELFGLGVGNFGEPDVKAGARALTGWVLADGGATARFVPRRHDDTPQSYLGATGVHDVATVVAALTDHPAHRTFVATRVCRELLGVTDAATVGAVAAAYEAGGRRLDAAARAALQAGLGGATGPIVSAPVPWLVTAQRVTGATAPTALLTSQLPSSGQIPLVPPNVAGWPGGEAWFASGTVVARVTLADALARATAADHPALVAAGAHDLAAMARALGLPGPGFGAATTAALHEAGDPRAALALALVSPEFVLT